jgi:hypothetical protein
MTKPWFTDPRMLNAGDARGLDHTAPADDGELVMSIGEFGAIDGDLDAHAARLGIDVATLVRLRARGRGFHRRPARPLGEILTALTWRFRR